MNNIVKNWVATSNYDLQTADALYKAGRYLYQDTAKRILTDTKRMIKWLKQHLKSEA
jgi:hypothetical protein